MFTDGRRQKIFVQEKCMEHAFKVRESVCKNNKCKQTFGCTIYARSDSAFTAGLPIKAPNYTINTLRIVAERVVKNPCV